jgi:hypothetical protein
MLRRSERIHRMPTAAEAAMRDDDNTPDHVVDRKVELPTLAVENRRRAGAADKVRQVARAGERAALAKQHELDAHARAIELHERAAELQERLGHHDRAANARAHAQHARAARAGPRRAERAGTVGAAGRFPGCPVDSMS